MYVCMYVCMYVYIYIYSRNDATNKHTFGSIISISYSSHGSLAGPAMDLRSVGWLSIAELSLGPPDRDNPKLKIQNSKKNQHGQTTLNPKRLKPFRLWATFIPSCKPKALNQRPKPPRSWSQGPCTNDTVHPKNQQKYLIINQRNLHDDHPNPKIALLTLNTPNTSRNPHTVDDLNPALP